MNGNTATRSVGFMSGIPGRWRGIARCALWLAALIALPAQAGFTYTITDKSLTVNNDCPGGGGERLYIADLGADPGVTQNLTRYTLKLEFTDCRLSDGTVIDGSIVGEVKEYSDAPGSGSCAVTQAQNCPGYSDGSVTIDLTIDGHSISGSTSYSLLDNIPFALTEINGRHYVDKGKASYRAPLEHALRAAAAVPETGLWVVTSEANGLPGRGFQLEVQNQKLVATVYGFESSGRPAFYLASGAFEQDRFTAPLIMYRNGTTLGGAPQSANEAGTAGTVAFSFTDSTHGTVAFPGETPQEIRKFDWSATADGADRPLPGLWVVASEVDGKPGRGLQLEAQGQTLVMTVYAYQPSGEGIFYLAAGALRDGEFSAPLYYYRDGKSFGGSVRAAALAGKAGDVRIRFTGNATGEIVFPGEPARAIRKFVW